METLHTIVTALALGALARQWASAHDSILEVYVEMKQLLRENYPAVDLSRVEESPQSSGAQFLLADDLSNAAATQNESLLRQARELLALVNNYNPELVAKLAKRD